jgi:hypothetical protein
LRLEERKIMGSEYINPQSPQQNRKFGAEYFLALTLVKKRNVL